MTNDNETVEQVCEEMRGREWDSPSFDAYAMNAAREFANDWANRILAAHKREIRERDAEIVAKAIIIDAKDAEIEDLKMKNTEAFKAVLKRDALIKELYDAINKYRKEDCPSCDMKRKAECVLRNRPCAKYKKHRALSLRAAEVLGLIDSAQEIINDLAKTREVVK